jgi:hypothetical protein
VSQKLAAKSVSIAICFAKTFKKSEVLAAAGTIFITQIAPGDSNVGFRPFSRTARLATSETYNRGDSGTNNWFDESEFKFLPPWRAG